MKQTNLVGGVLWGSLFAVACATSPKSGDASSEHRELRSKLTVEGPITYQEVAAAIAANHSHEEVLACYESGAEWIDVKFSVDPRGAAHDVSTSGPLFAPDRTKTCLETLVRATRYPKAKEDAPTEVKWSLTYFVPPRGQALGRGQSNWMGLGTCPREPCPDQAVNDNPSRAINQPR